MASSSSRKRKHDKSQEASTSKSFLDLSGKESRFVEGAITRLKLENFVTYDSVEFKPGPHLNVIIGPNGTGKSTIVCAICLGLAGNTKLLGRAHAPTEFIKHGSQKCIIEIELFNPDGANYVIKREINKSKANTNTWTVNGRSSSQKAVEETVARLNIQVGNLCQFLPQDKVADFAKMTPQELLENTEKAVGEKDLYENHCRLKNAREEARQLELQFETLKSTLESEKKKNMRLEQDVKNFEERQSHLDKINLLKMKRPWMEYEEKRNQWKKEKEKREILEKKVKEVRAENAPLKRKYEEACRRKSQYESLSVQKYDLIKKQAHLVANKSREIEKQTDEMCLIQEELKEKKASDADKKRKQQELQQQISGLEAEVSNLKESEDVQPLMQQCKREITEINRVMTQNVQNGEEIRSNVSTLKNELKSIKSSLDRLKDVKNRRLEMLKQRDRSTFDVVIWLRENRHRFRGTIHEPMQTVINVKNPNHAKYVESQISNNDMKAFVCEEPEDMSLFLNLVRDELKMKVNAVQMPRETLDSYQPKYPIGHYRDVGFHSYLKDLFVCPDAVMRYLCAMNRVHLVPVGTAETKNRVNEVIAKYPELSFFYTENHQYNIRKSRYGDHQTSTRCVEIRRASVLTVAVDVERENELTRDLNETQNTLQMKEQEYRHLQQENKEHETKMNKLREKNKRLAAQRDHKRILVQKINSKNALIRNLQEEAIDLAAEERRAVERIRQTNNKKCQLLLDLKDHIKQCHVLSEDRVRCCMKQAKALKEMSQWEDKLRNQSSEVQFLETSYENQKQAVTQIKEEARKLLMEAKKATGTPNNEELSPAQVQAFETCPNALDEIDAAIHQEQARADLTIETDETVIREYKRRKKEIEQLKKDTSSKESVLSRHKTEIEEIRAKWIEPLNDLIGRINQNFGYFFKCMKCAGEVDLSTPENPEDYEKYGVRIKVKYRDNEQLRELTPFHQSGGERSVATILYMMALQELTKVPFRCVDEINQGMDPVNERKVFELVVSTACRENTAQYFLLTPKLLPDLEYSDNMTVLCVYNGPHMLNHTEWNLRKFLKRRERMED